MWKLYFKWTISKKAVSKKAVALINDVWCQTDRKKLVWFVIIVPWFCWKILNLSENPKYAFHIEGLKCKKSTYEFSRLMNLLIFITTQKNQKPDWGLIEGRAPFGWAKNTFFSLLKQAGSLYKILLDLFYPFIFK